MSSHFGCRSQFCVFFPVRTMNDSYRNYHENYSACVASSWRKRCNEAGHTQTHADSECFSALVTHPWNRTNDRRTHQPDQVEWNWSYARIEPYSYPRQNRPGRKVLRRTTCWSNELVCVENQSSSSAGDYSNLIWDRIEKIISRRLVLTEWRAANELRN